MAKDPAISSVSRYDEFGESIKPVDPPELKEADLREELNGRPIGELRQMAASLAISGRSKMGKEKLIEAILRAYGFAHAEEVVEVIEEVAVPTPSPHPPVAVEDLPRAEPEEMSVRVRRIKETSD